MFGSVLYQKFSRRFAMVKQVIKLWWQQASPLKKFAGFGAVLIIFLLISGLIFAQTKKEQQKSKASVDQPETQPQRTDEETLLDGQKKESDEQTSTSDQATPTTPSSSPQSSPTSPSPTPQARTPNPPQIHFNFPINGSSYPYPSNGIIAVVDVPAGGDTSGIERKQNVNNQGWSSYSPLFTLEVNPKIGENVLLLQYRNSYGDESQVYSLRFTVYEKQEVTIRVHGVIFADTNCDAQRGVGEPALSVPATMYLYKQPQNSTFATFTSGSNGNFDYSTKIDQADSFTLALRAVSPPGYKSHPTFDIPDFTVSADYPQWEFNYPQVPN